ncbi:ribonuclease domain-containing protein [Niabella ginsengisoli]|uniref:Ribonuclease n=1 Tax=Niabella ginsengisoli TaxID=522298 RepID=A0ABS9SF76_9BACT|nr:ribonuclease domain-containing protein [Niabella ginsengisoli]MCH5596976.1 ribonuclease [Niabella ginsengisoli]
MMMINNKRIGIIVLILLIVGGVIFFSNKNGAADNAFAADTVTMRIDELTSAKVVVPYVKKNHKLPDYYIKKGEARRQGWIASERNLCDVLPGKAIGGDVFSNREGNLPKSDGRKWFEADLNYNCGRRNADRLLFSSDGLIYVTYDHYKTFQQK